MDKQELIEIARRGEDSSHQFIDDKVGVQFRVVVRRGQRGSDETNPEPNVEPNPEPNEPNRADENARLLGMLQHDSKMTIPEMADRLKVSRETVKRLLKKLKASGELVREGGTRGHWRVVNMV